MISAVWWQYEQVYQIGAKMLNCHTNISMPALHIDHLLPNIFGCETMSVIKKWDIPP